MDDLDKLSQLSRTVTLTAAEASEAHALLPAELWQSIRASEEMDNLKALGQRDHGGTVVLFPLQT